MIKRAFNLVACEFGQAHLNQNQNHSHQKHFRLEIMLPFSNNNGCSDKSVFMQVFPEVILVCGLIIVHTLPAFAFGYFPLVHEPLVTTLAFTGFFALFQVLIFTFVWNYCKADHNSVVRNFENKLFQSNFDMFLLVGLCWLILYIGCILLGAPAFILVKETAVWATLVTTLISIPNLCLLGTNIKIWFKVLICGRYENSVERFLYFQSAGPILGSWASAIVIPLDWDRPWQIWPIPCVIGALVGYTLSILLSCCLSKQELKQEKVTWNQSSLLFSQINCATYVNFSVSFYFK